MYINSRNMLRLFTGMICFFVSDSAFCQEKVAAQAKAISADMFTPGVDAAKKIIDVLVEFLIKYSFQAIGGVIILLIGWYVAKIAAKFLRDFLNKHKVDVTITKFLVEIMKLAVMAFSALIALGNFGITIAPFIAGLSVAGFGLSFALQGPLSNYAAGATLIFTKPFKVGDVIEVTGVMGEVEDMTLARTLIRTVDGTLIVVPNKQIIGEIIHNSSECKKLDIRVGVGYSTDIDKAIDAVKNVVKSDPRVAAKPEPKIGIEEFGDSSINIYARIWCKQHDYFDVMFEANKNILSEFSRQNISMPFPQMEVNILNQKQN